MNHTTKLEYLKALFQPFKKSKKAKIYTSLTIVVDNKTFVLEVDEQSLKLLKEAMEEDFENKNIQIRELILAYVFRTIG
jgi:hypothetical protein